MPKVGTHGGTKFVGGAEGGHEEQEYGFKYVQDGVEICWLGPDVGCAPPLAAALLVIGVVRDMNKGKNSERNAGCVVSIYIGAHTLLPVLLGALSMPAGLVLNVLSLTGYRGQHKLSNRQPSERAGA